MSAIGTVLTVDAKVVDLTPGMFAAITQCGTAPDTGMEEVLIESCFPVDDACGECFGQLIQN